MNETDPTELRDLRKVCDVTITGFTLIRHAKPQRGGIPIAHFDCDLRGIELFGCRLLRRLDGGLWVQLPLMATSRGARSAGISDRRLFDQLRGQVDAKLQAFSGADARDVP